MVELFVLCTHNSKVFFTKLTVYQTSFTIQYFDKIYTKNVNRYFCKKPRKWSSNIFLKNTAVTFFYRKYASNTLMFSIKPISQKCFNMFNTKNITNVYFSTLSSRAQTMKTNKLIRLNSHQAWMKKCGPLKRMRVNFKMIKNKLLFRPTKTPKNKF